MPVLSITGVSTWRRRSIASASLKSTPSRAPRPIATMIETGVARPSAQGQAMIRTATAFTRAWARRGSGPQRSQTPNVAADKSATAGTKTPATASAVFCAGARLRWAFSTIRTIPARSVPEPIFSARMTSAPLPLIVAPTRCAPGPFSAGIGSPVTIDSSTALAPSRTTPSTGTFSPGRTRRRSPTCTRSTGMSSSEPSPRMRRAVLAPNSNSARRAPRVRLRAPSSRTGGAQRDV